MGVRIAAVAAELEGRSAPADVRTLGEALLLSGRDDAAIERLSALIGNNGETSIGDLIERSTDSASLSDLAAAYDERATRKGLAFDRLTAAAAAARAYALASSAPEAAWNRALTIEAIGLTEEARHAWRDYLSVDRDSPWSDEARRRLAVLAKRPRREEWAVAAPELERAVGAGDAAEVERVAARFPVRVHTLAIRQWIPRWAAAAARNDRGAALLFASIDGAARAIATSASDSQLREFVSAARSATDLEAFARAHIPFADAQRALREAGTMQAIAVLERANGDLRAANSPLATTALVDLASLHYHAGKHLDALRKLDEADVNIDAKRWPLQAAFSAWARGVSLTSLGRIEGAAAAYERTVELYRRVGDHTHLGMLEMLLGHNAEMHSVDDEWSHYIEGLRLADRDGDADRVLVVLDTFCRASLRADQPGFAAILNAAILARAEGPQWQPYRCHALITSCELQLRRGDRQGAVEQCRAAKAAFSSIVDVAVRDRLEADLEITSAAVADRGARIQDLSRAVEVSVRRKDLYRMSRVLLTRGRAYVEAVAPGLARADFEQALALIEEQRQRLETVDDRLAFFETSSAIAHALVRLLVDQGENEAALRVVERVRARALLETMTAAAASQMSLADAQSQIEPGRALVEYWSDDQELFTWVIRRGAVELIRHRVPRRILGEQSQRLVAAMSPYGSGDRSAAFLLYSHLIAPIERSFGTAQILTIIPDEAIADVPFNALSEGERAPFVIERFSISMAPSASAFAAAHSRLARRDSILIVANPETDGSYPRLDVQAETVAATRAVGRVRQMTGDAATVVALRSAAPNFDMLHIATHGVRDDGSGEPALVLAGGLLSRSDIEKTIAIRRGALVVLAACSTSRGRKSAEGNLSLARAFGAAGAGAVIASLWDATDADSGRLFSRFYEEIGHGATPAAALRSAQITLLRSNVRPESWAAYHIWGGA